MDCVSMGVMVAAVESERTRSMKLLLLQLLTSLTATGLITFTVTHMHSESFHIQWMLWILHWLVAWPIAFITIRWIAPIYKKLLGA